MKFIRDVIHPVIDFIYPPVCNVCNHLVMRNELPVCESCWKTLTVVYSSHPTWIDLKLKFLNRGNVKDLISCYLFESEGKLQEIIHLLKYKDMKSIGIRLGRDLGKIILSSPVYSSADYLVPVPLHRLKRRERGYNQSEFLCQGIIQIIPINFVPEFLKRIRYTQSQTKLNIHERIENVENAFEIHNPYKRFVKDKSFIIVDDVITTGSTINACASKLVEYGAASVYAASAALAK